MANVRTLTIDGVTYDLQDNVSGYVTTDENLKQTAATASSYSYWRPLIVGNSSSSTEGFTPSTNTAGAFTFNTLECQPSTGTIRLGKASFYNGSYTNKISPTTLTANRTITIPDATGTMALTSDISDAISAIPNPMIFKGSLGTGGTITSLPTAAAANEGFVYKVITDGTYASQAAKVGDTFISDGSAWILIPSGDEPSGTVTSVGLSNATNGGLTVSGSPITSSGTLTIGHSNVLTSAQTTSGVYPIKIDKNGHITEYGSAVTIPEEQIFSVTLTEDQNEDITASETFTDICDAYNDGTYITVKFIDMDGFSSDLVLIEVAEYDGYINMRDMISTVGYTGFTLYDDESVTKNYAQASTGDLNNTSRFVRGDSAIWRGTCSTAASTSAKAVTLGGFNATDQVVGVMVVVTFSNTNTATPSGLTLNVNSKGAKPIKCLKAGQLADLDSASDLTGTMLFFYDGTNWVTWYDTSGSAASDVMVVNITESEGVYSADSSFADIAQAINGGKEVILKHDTGDSIWIYHPRDGYSDGEGNVETLVTFYCAYSSTITYCIEIESDETVSFAEVHGNYSDLINKPTIPSITLNGSSTTSPSFYAPTSAGTSGNILKSGGSGAPSWSSDYVHKDGGYGNPVYAYGVYGLGNTAVQIPVYYGTSSITDSNQVTTKGYVDSVIPDVSGKIDTAGTGLSKSGTTLNHSNSVTAQTTSAVYPIKIDAQGHISEYGSAVTITDEKLSTSEGSSGIVYYPIMGSSGATAQTKKIDSTGLSYVFQAGTTSSYGSSTITLGNSTASGTEGNKYGTLKLYGTGTKYVQIKAVTATDDRTLTLPDKTGTIAITDDITDEKVKATAAANTTYYPVLGDNSGTASTKNFSSAFSYGQTSVSSSLSLGDTSRQGNLFLNDGYSNGYYSNIKPTTLSANRTLSLPDKTGTLAVTTDITDVNVTQTAATENSDYRILGAYTAGNSTETTTTRKMTRVLANAQNGILKLYTGGTTGDVYFGLTSSDSSGLYSAINALGWDNNSTGVYV